jgi:putative SOS response-associated peptidase YedK
MCGRYTLKANPKIIEEKFRAIVPDGALFEPRYNIAPTQLVETVREIAGVREYAPLKWGLVPSWAQDPAVGNKLCNARAETVTEKPSFREAFKRRRCLIPASGFYEWRKQTSGPKQPFYFYVKDEEVFAFAGLFEEWLDRETGELLETCSIITTTANKVLEPVHERMPVILKPDDYDQWLDPKEQNPQKLQELLRPFPSEDMGSRMVGTSVNFVSNNSPELIEESSA